MEKQTDHDWATASVTRLINQATTRAAEALYWLDDLMGAWL